MSASRKSKKAELRQQAINMYVRGGGFAAPSQPSADMESGVLEVFESTGGFEQGDHTSVSSDDERQAAEITSASTGDLETEAVDSALDIEPNPEAEDEEEAAAAPEEEKFMLDAWHAEFSDPGQRAMALAQVDAGESVLEVVIGTDDRIRVTNVKAYPWRAICSLKIQAADGSGWIGTAWLVGKRTLLTAGHCVYIHDRGGWASRIEVIPGRNAAERPFGSCFATSFRSVVGWTQKGLRAHDYAAIILPEDCDYGTQLGHFGIANLSDATLNNMTVNLSGYPGDKPPGTHWFHARNLESITPDVLTYDIDTAGGQSGAPVWRLLNGERHAVGIHTNGSPAGNSATRINSAVYSNIMQWIAEGNS